jgi:lactate permease
MPVDLWHVALASLPLVVLLVALLRLGWSGARSGLVALAVALVLAVTVFATPAAAVGVALGRGLAVSVDVLYIIWAALLLDRLADGAGAIESIGAAVGRLTTDRLWQLLIIGFAFSSFLQGVAGFGVPVAVTAPLLVGLGFGPLEAAAVPLLGHAWAVSMGTMGSSFQAIRSVTGLPRPGLGAWISILLGMAAVVTGFAVAHLHGGWAAVRRSFWGVLVLGSAMAATQLAFSLTRQWTIAAFAAGMVGMGVSMLLARHAQAHADRRNGSSAVGLPAREAMPARLAFLPYAILIVLVAAATLVGPLREALGRIQVTLQFPGVPTGRGWNAGASSYALPLPGHPGSLLLYTTALTALLYGRRGVALPAWRAVWTGARAQGVPTTVTIVLLVWVAMVMTYSGMTFLLARGLAAVFGVFFPFVSPFIGLIGTVITGSNTTSNLLFGALQRDGALLLALSPTLIAALQSAGGALGSMLTPAKVVLATATTGSVGQEGRVMRVTLRYALMMTAGMGLVGWLAAALRL